MPNAYEYYKGLPPWGKGLIVVGTGVVLFLIGDSIWNAVKQAKQDKENLKTATDSVNTLNQLAAQGELPTATDAQFQSWTSDLVTAMSGCSTNHSTLESVFSALNNDADLYKMIAVFGSQSIAGCTFIISWTSGGAFSLPAAISNYVSSDEKAILNGILASKGISYTFS